MTSAVPVGATLLTILVLAGGAAAATNPAAPCPTDLTVTPLGDGTMRLDWTPTPLSHHTLLWRGATAETMEVVGAVGFGVGTHVDSATEPGQSYVFMVTALVGAEESTGCAQVASLSVPVFPSAWALGLAGLGGLAAFLIVRRH